jgi:hypothetical protein
VVVRADAGPAVPRALLRAAVVAARPATDQDIDRYLVPHRGTRGYGRTVGVVAGGTRRSAQATGRV